MYVIFYQQLTYRYNIQRRELTPIPKKPGAPSNDRANLGPITNLSVSKIVERLVLKRPRTYLSSSSSLGRLQSAYRSAHSTETALAKVVNDLLTEVDSETSSVFLLLDLSAAFDTLDHVQLVRGYWSCCGVVTFLLLGNEDITYRGRATFQNCDINYRRASWVSFWAVVILDFQHTSR